MTIESVTYISDLNTSYPAAGDAVSEGENHIQNLKTALKNTFTGGASGLSGAVTASHAELNILDGATLSTAELNLLDGVTATTAELNYTDGVTSNIQTQLNNLSSYSGKMIQIGTTKTGGGASYDLTGLSSTYSYYSIEVIKLLPATDNVKLYLLTSTDGGSTWGSGYAHHSWWSSASMPIADGGGAAQTQLDITGSGATFVGNASNELGVCGHVEIWKPSDAAYCHVSWDLLFRGSDGNITKVSGAGYREAAADVDAVRLIFSSGNITSGTARLFARI